MSVFVLFPGKSVFLFWKELNWKSIQKYLFMFILSD